MAPKSVEVESPILARMRSASREALAGLLDKFDKVAGGLDEQGLSALAGDLTAVADVLGRETVVTRHLTVPTEDPLRRFAWCSGCSPARSVIRP